MASIALKERDYAPPLVEHPEQLPAQAGAHSDSESTATDSSDEFNWDEDEEEAGKLHEETGLRAKRGRALWLAFMKLARPVRTFFVGVVGCAILITPLLVFQLRFKSNVARPHVHAWYS
jgi:hypothetical protein